PDRMLIFASSEQLYILQSCDDFLVDGTFKDVYFNALRSFLQKLIHEEHATHAYIVHINSGEAPKHKSKINERF
ncbi:unnamed protein product, partial [Didymodactylos carnosus]